MNANPIPTASKISSRKAMRIADTAQRMMLVDAFAAAGDRGLMSTRSVLKACGYLGGLLSDFPTLIKVFTQ